MARLDRNRVLLLLLTLLFLGRSAFAQSTATITVSGAEVTGDSGTITISVSVNISGESTPLVETLAYGPFSTQASIASGFAAMFTQDFNVRHAYGLTACASAGSNIITFNLSSGSFGAVAVTGSITSFNMTSTAPEGFESYSSPLTFSYSEGDVALASSASDHGIFYTLDGSTAREASTEYTAPIALENPSTTTINAIAVNVGAGGGVVQNMNTASWCQVGSSGCKTSNTNWETVTGYGCTTTYDLPYMKTCTDSANNCGVTGGSASYCPSGGTFAQHLPAPSLDGETLHMAMETSTPNNNTQVLYTGNGNWPAPSATVIMQDFWILQGNAGNYKSYEDETDMELFDRDLQLDASLQCDSQYSYWRYNGKGGTWQNFPTTIAKDCPYPYGTLSIASPTQTSFTTSTAVDAGSIISVGACTSTSNCENIYIISVSGGSSGTSVTNSIRNYAAPGHSAQGTAQAWSSGTPWAEWVHVQWHATFNPGANNCTSFNTGNPIECVYFDYLIINGTLYGSTLYGGTQWGTTEVGGVTYSNLIRPAEPGYAGVQRCFNQFQLYSENPNPGTVDFYLDLDNVTCGYGTYATDSETFTVPFP